MYLSAVAALAAPATTREPFCAAITQQMEEKCALVFAFYANVGNTLVCAGQIPFGSHAACGGHYAGVISTWRGITVR